MVYGIYLFYVHITIEWLILLKNGQSQTFKKYCSQKHTFNHEENID